MNSPVPLRCRARIALLAVAAITLAASCSSTVTLTAAAPATPPDQGTGTVAAADAPVEPALDLGRAIAGRYEAGSCEFADYSALEVEPRCGWLSTPMLSSDGVEIELPVVIFDATGPEPSDDPIFYLHGGPGGGIVADVVSSYDSIVAPFVDARDVVLFDQRGSGLAEPVLNCAPAQNFWSEPEDDMTAFILTRAQRCAWRSRNNGIELGEFTKHRSADDVMVLARELGYDRINLVGTSWGGLLAHTVMQRYPELVRAAILNSPLTNDTDLAGSMPGSFRESLLALQAACDVDPVCTERHGDIVGRLRTVVAELDASPSTLELIDPPRWAGEDPRWEVELTGEDLLHLVFGLMYSPEAAASVPDMLLDLEQGDNAMASRLASVYGWGWGFDFPFLTYMCTDIVPASDSVAMAELETGDALFDRIDDSPDGRGHSAPALCDVMKLELPDTSQRGAPQTDVAALVLAGRLDPITAYSTGVALADSLPGGQFVGFEDLGHGALQDWCASMIAQAFLAEPTAQVDAECAGERGAARLADAALSVHPANEGLASVEGEVWLAGASVSLRIPDGYDWDWLEDGSMWWRNDAPYDLTALAVFASQDEPAYEVADGWLQHMGAFDEGEIEDVTIGGAAWTRRPMLSSYGVSLVLYDRADGEVSFLVQAYPDEAPTLEPQLAEWLGSSLAAARLAPPA